jgi:glycosyltransferase involved in cell wall biosynthesis
MEFSKAVIGARIGAIASLIDEGKDGLLFEPDNAEDLTKQIKNILRNGHENKLMGEAGYAKLQRLYTWDKITETFRSAYLKAIEEFKQRKIKLK